MSAGPCRQLRGLQLEELDDFVTQSGEGGWQHQLPPPGMTIEFDRSPLLSPPRVCGVPTGNHPGRRYWETAGNLAFNYGDDAVGVIARWLAQADPIVVATTGAFNYPFVYEEGHHMRWIRSTFRGTLAGGVEQFQWKLDWGIPGNDPTLGENEAPAFAQFLGEQWAVEFLASGAGVSMQSLHPASVKYTEVGVTSWLQDSPKNADGSGGDAHQEYPTAWYGYAVGTEPKGNSVQSCLPLEVSCGLTFDTDKRGPRGRGRIYLPPFDSSRTDSNGLFVAGAVTSAAEAIGNLFDDVKGSTYNYVPLVVSMREKILNEIQQIRVGKVPDAQRRRRRSQDEAYITAWTNA